MFFSSAITYSLLALCVAVWGVPINDVGPQLSAAQGNRTALKSQIAPGLTSNANYRGTLDIVWSCVLTLTACIYTALHLNIPSNTWRKVKWAAIALVSPELVLYSALVQFQEARSLVKKLNKQRFGWLPQPLKQETSETSGNIKPFDIRYGFYVVMGGFTVNVEKMHNTLSRATLTPKGLITLAKRGRFLDISRQTLSDKSRANIITKALICIQVLWMVVQCLARKAVGYPLTLLEIHTMVHVVCALALYTLWWKKPLDIKEPTLLDLSLEAKYLELIALMLICSKRTSDPAGINAPNGSELDSLISQKQPEQEPSTERAISSDTESHLSKSAPSAKDIRRRELACQEISRERSAHQGLIGQNLLQKFDPYRKTLTVHSRTTYYDPNIFDFSVTGILSLVLLPVVYGGIHLAAWGFEFPSPAESLLWKISCFFIMGAIPILVFVFSALWKLIYSDFNIENIDNEKVITVIVVVRGTFFMLYASARIFLVLESFLSLRHVPIGVYAAVPWVQNIPHI